MKIAAIAALWHCASAFAPSARAGAPSAARSRGRALFSDAPGGCTNDPEAAFAAKIKAVAEQMQAAAAADTPNDPAALAAAQFRAETAAAKAVAASAGAPPRASAPEPAPTGELDLGGTFHHVTLHTKNIENAVKFYSLLGLQITHKYLAPRGVTGGRVQSRAAWLEGAGTRLELVEVPPEHAPPARAIDLSPCSNYSQMLGLNHFALDVTQVVAASDAAARAAPGGRTSPPGLKGWLSQLNARSEREFKKSIRLLLKPEQQMMWNKVYEVGLINDPDGVLIKLMNFQTELTHFMYPDWEMPDESAPEGARDDGTVKLEFDAQVDDDGNFILDEDGKFVQ